MTRLQSMLLASAVVSLTVYVGTWLFKPDASEASLEQWAQVEAPTVELKFAGIQPRAPLRLHPQAGQRSELELNLWDSSTLKMLSEPAESAWHGAVQVRTEVDEVLGDGRIRFSWSVRSSKVVTEQGTGRFAGGAAATGLKALKGLKGEVLLDDRGHVLEASVKGGGSGGLLGPQMRVSIERMFSEPGPQLPTEPIGERAEWVVRRVILNAGIPMTWEQRWKLERFTDDGFDLSVRLNGSGDAPTLDLPGLAAFEGSEPVRLTQEGGGTWSYGANSDLVMQGEGWARTGTGLANATPGLDLQLSMQGESEVTIQGE